MIQWFSAEDDIAATSDDISGDTVDNGKRDLQDDAPLGFKKIKLGLWTLFSILSWNFMIVSHNW